MNSESSEKKPRPVQPSAVAADQEFSETELDAIAGGKTDRMEGKLSPESANRSDFNSVSEPFHGKIDRLP